MGHVVLVRDQDAKKPGSKANAAVVSVKCSLVVAAVGTCALIVLVCTTRADGTVFAQIGRDTVFTAARAGDRKSTRLNSSHVAISYAVLGVHRKNAAGA